MLKIYTDCSKCDDGVKAAVVTDTTARSASLPRSATVFTAELYAISIALSIIEESSSENSVIFSDSKSTLQILSGDAGRNPLAERIQNVLHNMNKGKKRVYICWIPRHTRIAGNEKTDLYAKRASLREPELIPIPYQASSVL